jgi:hypothetical protein
MIYNTSDLNLKIMDHPNDLYDICEEEGGWILRASCTDTEYESLFLSNIIRNQNDHDVFCSLNIKAINDVK